MQERFFYNFTTLCITYSDRNIFTYGPVANVYVASHGLFVREVGGMSESVRKTMGPV